MRPLALLLLLLTGCQQITAVQVPDSKAGSAPWPTVRSFEATYSADSIYYDLRLNPAPGTQFGRGPGQWWWESAIVCEEFPGYQIFQLEAYPDRVDVLLPDSGNESEWPLLGSVPIVVTPTLMRFAFPRKWSPETQSAPSWASCLILSLSPDGSEVPGLLIEDIPERRDAPLATTVPSRPPTRRWW